MSTFPPDDPTLPNCSSACSPLSTAQDLNRDCFCVAVDPSKLRGELEALLASQGLPGHLIDSHPHLFSALPVYVSRRHIEAMTRVVAALEEVVALKAYREAALRWAPEIAAFDPGSSGGVLGLDFHLGPDGPRLIEINTNPGGLLLNTLLGHAHRACMGNLTVAPTDMAQVEDAALQALIGEWRLQRKDSGSGLVAIVDEAPEQQYLYPEFLLFQQLLQRHGHVTRICAPQALSWNGQTLRHGDEPVGRVYNRLTDFALQEPAHDAIRSAYLAGAVALVPHPRAHALYADKRNLSLLGSRSFLESAAASQASIDALLAAVPATQLLTPENREAMWARRGQLFFKPATGFGSKAAYRGDKLTHRVWDQIAQGTYVAQDIVPPSERHLMPGVAPLKLDLRCYAYGGKPLLFAARLYQGQTTNFRTAGGGFAPVLSSA